MEIHILTLFPDMFSGPFEESIVKRARDSGLTSIHLHDIRDYAHDKHRTVDDYPYGGGAGMVMKPEPIFEAVEDVVSAVRRDIRNPKKEIPVILLTPQGQVFNQDMAQELLGESHLVLICGHYEGIDARVSQHLATHEISLGDYVLTGGELAAMVVTDAIVRLIPGVLGSNESLDDESHTNGLLQHPQYTRPPEYQGLAVPAVLLSGNHGEIARWRRAQAVLQTKRNRPELLKKSPLTAEDCRVLNEAEWEESS